MDNGQNEQYNSIDPKKIVEQDGENTGNIADVNLAMIGAERENVTRSMNGNIDETLVNIGPINNMAEEVGRRAEALVSDASPELKESVRLAAEARFKSELQEKSTEKRTAADAKARDLLAKIEGGASIKDILPDVSETPQTSEIPEVSES
ncbi:MAG TPA: hypothetical protein VFD55_00155 [Candidatus Angelobacter sp.]|nr:hypothetical protein [Candidatus Angelobacter sp.]